jgi:PAS domain S-box-containing protein
MNEPTMPETVTNDQIIALQARLTDAENALRAIHQGEVDAITVSLPDGEQVYSLTSAERVYRDMIETMSEGALNVTVEGMILYCNDRFARMTSTDLATVMGSNLLAYFVEPDRAAISTLLDNATTGVKRIRAGLRSADGGVLPVNVAIHGQHRDNQPYTIITIISELTEMLAAQAATMSALRYARHLIEAILDPLVTIGTNGKITDVNHASELVTGRLSSELIGSDFADYFTEPEKARAFYEQVYSKGYVIDEPLTIRNNYGAVTAMLYNASLYREDDGAVSGVVAVGRDITRHYEDRIQPKQGKNWWTIARWPVLGVALLGFLLVTSTLLLHVEVWTKAQIVTPVTMVKKPYLHAGDHRPTTVFHAGEVAFVHISSQRDVSCFALVHQRILSLINGDIFNRIVWSDPPVSYGYTEAGHYETDHRFDVPADLPHGDYFLERSVTYTCGATTVNQTQPPFSFTVVK